MRLIGLLGSVVALVAGCSSAPAHDAPGGDEQSGLSSCGLPPHKVCNVAKCTADGWVLWPQAKGTTCKINGAAGACNGGVLGPPGQIEPDEIGQCVATQSGSIAPKFFVLSVVYAPPGTAGSGTKSTVTYANGSTAGTETKVSNAFKAGITETAEASIAGFATLDATSGYSLSTTAENTLSLKKSTSLSITDHGPSADGISHDADLIYLWLNPVIDIVGNGPQLQWTMSSSGAAMDIQYVSVGQLKGLSPISPGVLARFAAYGITSADYGTMLARDPFAYGSTAIDANRYVQTWTTLPYEPPLAAGEEPPSTTLTVGNETTSAHASSYQSEYSVGYSLKVAPPSFTSWLSASITTTGTFTWTNSGSTTSSTTSTQNASVTMTGPSFGYTGPTDMAVYYDTVYQTFLFAPVTGPLHLVGFVTDTLGAPIANAEVIVTTPAGRMRTITGARGEYRIYGAAPGRAKVSALGVTHDVVLGARAVRDDIRVAPRLVGR